MSQQETLGISCIYLVHSSSFPHHTPRSPHAHTHTQYYGNVNQLSLSLISNTKSTARSGMIPVTCPLRIHQWGPPPHTHTHTQHYGNVTKWPHSPISNKSTARNPSGPGVTSALASPGLSILQGCHEIAILALLCQWLIQFWQVSLQMTGIKMLKRLQATLYKDGSAVLAVKGELIKPSYHNRIKMYVRSIPFHDIY